MVYTRCPRLRRYLISPCAHRFRVQWSVIGLQSWTERLSGAVSLAARLHQMSIETALHDHNAVITSRFASVAAPLSAEANEDVEVNAAETLVAGLPKLAR